MISPAMKADAPLMSEPIADPGRRELAKAERRQKIMQAAKELIRETGDMNLSMRELARRAEVSVATSYNLFGSKRAVVVAVLEDERDFTERFHKLKVANAIERIFEAHTLAYGYFVQDPDFYRPLWRMLLDTSTKDDSGLMSPERQARTRAEWHAILKMAQDEKLLLRDMSVDVLERLLSHHAGGNLLAWAMGNLETGDLVASVGLGYAMILKATATPEGSRILDRKVGTFRSILAGRRKG